MTLIPEPDIDYKELDRAKVGEVFYSKTGFFKIAKWVLKKQEGFIVFDSYDSAMLAGLIFQNRRKKKK